MMSLIWSIFVVVSFWLVCGEFVCLWILNECFWEMGVFLFCFGGELFGLLGV